MLAGTCRGDDGHAERPRGAHARPLPRPRPAGPARQPLRLGMEVDFVFPGTRVLVEADSWRYHHSRAQCARGRDDRDRPHDAREAGVMRVTPDWLARAASRSVERLSSPVPQRYRAPRPSAVRLLHTVDAAAPRSASAVTSTRVTHFTHWKPRWPGTTRRHGAPWPCVSGSPPTWVASTRSRASARAKLQR